MTLNANEPVDTRMVSELATYIREARAAINALTVGSNNIAATTLAVPPGTTSLSVGVDLADAGLELVVISGTGLSDIASILGGSNGEVKIFIFQDADLDFADSMSKANGTFYLNHLPAASDFDAQQDDILALVNIGGDGASIHGYWKELFRSISVK